MPWKEVSIMEERREFVRLASREGANVSLICARFGISRQTGYKWLRRDLSADEDFHDRSRRPLLSPKRTLFCVEVKVLDLRREEQSWGARKIAWKLANRGGPSLAASTVHAILKRYNRIEPQSRAPSSYRRFEKEAPNQMWQMDFKGYVTLNGGVVCHPLTVIDDHARFAVGLAACANQKGNTVKPLLEQVFSRYGLPEAFYVDNGAPWGGSGRSRWTRFSVLKLGIQVIHGRPYYPQGRGKIERFHRTLNAEVFAARPFNNLTQVQRRFDQWRADYNMERPHEALDMNVPASRYKLSPRSMPDRVSEIEYDSGEILRKVDQTNAYLSFKGRNWKVPKAFKGETVAIRPRAKDGIWVVCFGATKISTIDLNT